MSEESESTKLALPYYPDDSKQIIYQLPSHEPTSLELMVRSCRLGVHDAKDALDQVIQTGKAHTEGNWDCKETIFLHIYHIHFHFQEFFNNYVKKKTYQPEQL